MCIRYIITYECPHWQIEEPPYYCPANANKDATCQGEYFERKTLPGNDKCKECLQKEEEEKRKQQLDQLEKGHVLHWLEDLILSSSIRKSRNDG